MTTLASLGLDTPATKEFKRAIANYLLTRYRGYHRLSFRTFRSLVRYAWLMSKKDGFAVGIALISSALAVLLKTKFWEYTILIIGVLVISVPYFQDYLFGEDRLSAEVIRTMSATDYQARLNDRKFERWIKYLVWRKKRLRP